MMHLKITICLAFLFFLVPMTAQIKYSYEEIKKTYETETIILQQNAYEQNGRITSMNPLIPFGQLRREIETNGGPEAIAQYKKYLEVIKNYWLVTGLGIVALIAFIATSAGAGVITTTLLLISIGSLVWSLALMFLGRKAYNLLARTVWLYNWHVLFKKKPAAG